MLCRSRNYDYESIGLRAVSFSFNLHQCMIYFLEEMADNQEDVEEGIS